MACPTCRREDVPDTCGSKLGKPCPCCGMVIIATAEQPETTTPEENPEEGEQNS